MDQHGVTILSKEEKVGTLYAKSVVPLFEDFENLNIPTTFQIDQKDVTINAGAAYDYIEVSQGFIQLENKPIQVFVLAHEVSHLAIMSQAQIFGLEGNLPKGTETNEYKKVEYLSDLIAIHLIKKTLPGTFNLLRSNFINLEGILGKASFTHPSGKDRIKSLNVYLTDIKGQNDEFSFKNRFVHIWEMK